MPVKKNWELCGSDKTYVLPTGWNQYVTNCGINKQTKTEPGKQEVKIELPM